MNFSTSFPHYHEGIILKALRTKKILLVSFTCCCIYLNFPIHAQGNVGIGTNIPNFSAILELLSANKGMLVPRR